LYALPVHIYKPPNTRVYSSNDFVLFLVWWQYKARNRNRWNRQ